MKEMWIVEHVSILEAKFDDILIQIIRIYIRIRKNIFIFFAYNDCNDRKRQL